MYEAMEDVNNFIRWYYKPEIHKVKFPISPDLDNTSKNGEIYREKFCTSTPGGEEVWKTYLDLKEEYTNLAADLIGEKLEKQFGVNAIHCGNFPKDWVKPGGLEDDNYRTTMKGMSSSSDVIEKGELKFPKHERENELFERLVNITNHARTHKCSAYCWNPKKVSQKYDEEKHKKVKTKDL